MSEAETLWAACLDQPTDDTLRLVLADLLRESDAPDQQARGRFLWAGVTAARLSAGADLIDDPLYYTAQSELCETAATGAPAHWLGSLGIGPDPLGRSDWMWEPMHDRVNVRIGDTTGTYARGMLTELNCTLEQWLAVVRPALGEWPVELVTVADTPGLVLAVERPTDGWRLSARLRVPGRRVPIASTLANPLPQGPAVLIDWPGDWRAEAVFPDRGELVARAADASAALVAELREDAGVRWPPPPRRRRR